MIPKYFSDALKNNKEWYDKSYSSYLFGIYQQALAVAHEANETYAMPYGIVFINHQRRHHFDWFWNINLMKEKRNLMLKKVMEDGKFISEYQHYWEEKRLKFLDYYKEMSHVNFSKHTYKELKIMFKKLHSLYVIQAAPAYTIDIFLSSSGEDWLLSLIKDELGQNVSSEVVEKLTSPVYLSFVNDSELGLLKIAQEIKNKNPSVKKMCEKYVEDFFWIKTTYVHFKRITTLTVYKDALLKSKQQGLSEIISKEEKRLSINKKQKKELFEKLNISKKLQRVIEASELFTHIQDMRKEGVLRSNTVFYELLEWLSIKERFDKEHVFYLTSDELFDILDGTKVDWNQVEKRCEKGGLILVYDKKSLIVTPDSYDELLTIDNFFSYDKNVKEVKGTTAFKGVVTGEVRVLRDLKEISKFKEGYILVANQTTPEFVPAMKLAGAIVTDQGGITCHAAIVARELKKPCVIGTGNATKVLKDGDMVQVDAVNGVVKKIK